MKTLQKLITSLKHKKLSLAAVESCSGGYLSYLLTKIPGSSKIFKGGIVAYSLEAKNKFFKIPLPLLKKTQGVSSQVALLLAKRVRKIFNCDIGMSLVGFAGPEVKMGKKVGTVFIGIADKKGIMVKKVIIKGDRDFVRKKASLKAIELIYKKLNLHSA
jgi:PncC family amidohydrolase